MKLECVIICINYSDFLSHTLPSNKSLCDRIVVVTDAKDTKTKTVCEFWNVQCVQTDDVYQNGSKIPNKGIAINKGLEVLSKSDWVLHMDADVFLLPLTRQILERMTLEKDSLYGTDRMMCESYEDWHYFLHPTTEAKSLHEGWIYLHMDRFKIVTRLVQYHEGGYWPIGYFQLWNPKGSGVFDYPVEGVGFDRTDVVHLKRWESSKRRFIPDFVVVHLSNESHGQGQNWHGRKTRMFEPEFQTNLVKGIKNFFGKIKEKIKKFIKKKETKIEHKPKKEVKKEEPPKGYAT